MTAMEEMFEKFVRDHRAEFDSREPDPGMWNNIRTTVNKSRTIAWKTILSRVAMVILIFSVSYFVNETVHRYRDSKTASHLAKREKTPPGLRETEAYYTKVVDQKMKELKPVMANCPALAEELQVDMTELDSVYADLKKDLKENMANQEVIEAIIENYRLKISILEDLLKEVKPGTEECISKNDQYAL
jgi:hypothetical protein